MTIKELENLVGMTRASIRFYEEAGLISPARQPNGYRDYSQEDADTLSKIKLFRQLHLDLDTIRAVQSEELALAQALERQLTELETDQAALDRARQVCRELRQSGISYAALNPRPWLDQLERDPAPTSPRYAPPKDRYVPPESTHHPWRRYFARSIDLLICGIIWLAVCALGFHWPPSSNLLVNLLNTYVEWALLFLLEPVCLHFLGTTPGKAIFGISIRHKTGRKLTWNEAMWRTWDVFGKGCGYAIPFYDLWRNWKSYRVCQDGEREPWEDCGGGENYEIADDRAWRCLACVGAYILCLALTVLIALQAMLPPNRGALTAAEFYENYNFYLNYLGMEGYPLDETGQWVIPERDEFTIVLLDGPESQFSLTLTDGAVTAVTITRQAETKDALWLSNTEEQLALLAIAGSLPELNCLNFHATGWASAIDEQTAWNYDLTLRDLLRVTQSTKMEGFEDMPFPAYVLLVQEGQTGSFFQTVQIELVK